MNPQEEDKKHCAEGTHLWILKHDGSVYCYTCDEVKK
jgi:hypothetical protein